MGPVSSLNARFVTFKGIITGGTCKRRESVRNKARGGKDVLGRNRL